jgi:hypothetical protein
MGAWNSCGFDANAPCASRTASKWNGYPLSDFEFEISNLKRPAAAQLVVTVGHQARG